MSPIRCAVSNAINSRAISSASPRQRAWVRPSTFGTRTSHHAPERITVTAKAVTAA